MKICKTNWKMDDYHSEIAGTTCSSENGQLGNDIATSENGRLDNDIVDCTWTDIRWELFIFYTIPHVE